MKHSCKYCGKEANYQLKNGAYCCCKSCSSCPVVRKKISESNKNKPKSEIHREKMKMAKIGTKKTPKTIEKISMTMRKKLRDPDVDIEQAKNGVLYSKLGCKIIDEFNLRYGYDFQHALNGGEVKIGKYYVDGYDKDKNIVIEIDGCDHMPPSVIERDMIRDECLKNLIGCEIVRISI